MENRMRCLPQHSSTAALVIICFVSMQSMTACSMALFVSASLIEWFPNTRYTDTHVLMSYQAAVAAADTYLVHGTWSLTAHRARRRLP
jgi:hypothetical protein